MLDGQRVSPSVPYGYFCDPKDKRKLIIENFGMSQIANTFFEEKILIPMTYVDKHCPENCHHSQWHDLYCCTGVVMRRILKKQEYLEHTVLGKTICTNYKTKN